MASFEPKVMSAELLRQINFVTQRYSDDSPSRFTAEWKNREVVMLMEHIAAQQLVILALLAEINGEDVTLTTGSVTLSESDLEALRKLAGVFRIGTEYELEAANDDPSS